MSGDSISSIKCLGLWESVYPPTLTSGLPQRHHVVFYILVHVKGMSTEDVEQRLKLDPEETEATVWVCSDGDAEEEKKNSEKRI